MKDLEKIRAIFLSPDIDEETLKDNEAKIIEWQQSLSRNRAYADWKESDITKEIVTEAKRIYKDASIQLAFSRAFDERGRAYLWAQQDAAKLLLSLVNKDVKSELDALQREIQTAINATN